MNLPALEDQARVQNTIKASKTIAITIAAYFLSYLPAVGYAILSQQEASPTNSWFGFIAWYATYFSSAANPFIYYYRSSRFRSSLRQFVKDPFGETDFKEKPQDRKRKGKNDVEEIVGEKTRRIDKTGLGGKYRGTRRDGITVWSIEALQSHLFNLEHYGSTGIENQLPNKHISAALLHHVIVALSPAVARLSVGGKENFAPKHERQRSNEKKEEKQNKTNQGFQPIRSEGDMINKRKIFFSKGQVHPLSKSCENIFCYKKEEMDDKGNEVLRQISSKRDKIGKGTISFSKTKIRPLSKSCENMKYFS